MTPSDHKRQFDHRPGVFLVSFNGPDFQQDLAYVKSLPGARWDPKPRHWIVNANKETWLSLQEHGFVPVLEALLLVKRDKPRTLVLPKLPGELRPYQVEGVSWLHQHKCRGLLADDMGLGKTVQAAVTFLVSPRDDRPLLLICTASMKTKWQREIKKWCRLHAHIIYGRQPDHLLPKAPIYIINYEILGHEDPTERKARKAMIDEAKARNQTIRPKALPVHGWCEVFAPLVGGWVADECHHLSDPHTIQTRAWKKIHNRIHEPYMVLPMSGTPIDDKPVQFFNVLNAVAPHLFANEWHYRQRYCAPRNNGFGMVYDGASHIPELREKLKHVMIRRLKVDVLKDLPPKQRIVVPMELDTVVGKKYRQAGADFAAWLKSQEKLGPEAEQKVHDLARLAYAAKRDSIVWWIRDYLDAGNKLVIGAWYHTTVDDLMSVFGKVAVMLDGSVPSTQRQDLEDRFQKDPKTKLFVGQIKAAGEGLTLTAAPATALVEFGQTSGQHNQFEDRVHRIGQTADSVFAYYLTGVGTIDEDLMRQLEVKAARAASILDGNDDYKFFGGSTGNLALGALQSLREGQ